MAKISVIVPIFKVEKYIEKGLHSLFQQTLNDIEYIFIDDCSPDNSINILKQVLLSYPLRSPQVKILRHKINKGVAAARTSGILSAKGDYIIHFDPDDYIELDMYEKLYNKAIQDKSDIVTCYYYEEQKDSKKLIKKKFFTDSKKNIEFLPTGFLVDKLVKREIIFNNNILPYKDCNYAEDLGCSIRIFYYSNSVSVVEEGLYHYQRRNDSATLGSRDDELIEGHIKLVENIIHFLEDKGSQYTHRINSLKFHIKMYYKDYYEKKGIDWYNLYKECHKEIFSYKSNSFKSRLILYLALNNKIIYSFFQKIGKL